MSIGREGASNQILGGQRGKKNPWLHVGEILFCFVLPSDSPVSVSDPWRSFWPVTAPLMGHRLASFVASGTTELQGHGQVCHARRRGPKTLLRITDTNFDCAFVENAHVFIDPKIAWAWASLGHPVYRIFSPCGQKTSPSFTKQSRSWLMSYVFKRSKESISDSFVYFVKLGWFLSEMSFLSREWVTGHCFWLCRGIFYQFLFECLEASFKRSAINLVPTWFMSDLWFMNPFQGKMSALYFMPQQPPISEAHPLSIN